MLLNKGWFAVRARSMVIDWWKKNREVNLERGRKNVFVITAIELWYHYVRQSKESATGRVILGGGQTRSVRKMICCTSISPIPWVMQKARTYTPYTLTGVHCKYFVLQRPFCSPRRKPKHVRTMQHKLHLSQVIRNRNIFLLQLFQVVSKCILSKWYDTHPHLVTEALSHTNPLRIPISELQDFVHYLVNPSILEIVCTEESHDFGPINSVSFNIRLWKMISQESSALFLLRTIFSQVYAKEFVSFELTKSAQAYQWIDFLEGHNQV